MSVNDQATTEKDCSAVLRYFLVFLLVVCASAILLFEAVAAHSTTLRRSMRTVPLALRSPLLHESVTATLGNDAAETAGLDADHALGAAALIGQDPAAPSTSYTIHIRLSGGTEQVIPVIAPPGGLLLEVRDMTGDNVRNDFVLRPALIHWPLIVLLNDGHDHFTIAISSALPSSLDSGSRASRGRQIPEALALTSASSKAAPQASSRQIQVAGLLRDFLSSLTQGVTSRTGHRSVSGRAPPAIMTRI